ncbi:hypothetical protein AVEN_26250-1 [Araneus ventricosus]|uniref:Uncharacterized protein n=1 Tax=Araneus ventricosus TaxID=182803 RepID=A0A4Y2AM83_ARAVE|nr:hypothetical protein AVEN_26250-1 [Araneus ventricosus]
MPRKQTKSQINSDKNDSQKESSTSKCENLGVLDDINWNEFELKLLFVLVWNSGRRIPFGYFLKINVNGLWILRSPTICGLSEIISTHEVIQSRLLDKITQPTMPSNTGLQYTNN